MLQIRLLGQFDVRASGRRVALNTRAAQSLFAYLVLNAGVEQRREKLAGLFWTDLPEESARKYLRQELWRIRKALVAQNADAATMLRADDLTVSFAPADDFWLDVAQLEAALPPDAPLNERINQVSVFQGELLPGFYEDWVQLEREHVQAVFETRMRELLEHLIAGQHWQTVVTWSEKWIALGQTPEAAYRALMLTYGMLGDRALCVATYERCVRALQNDLGVEPSAETRALYEELLRGDTIASVSLHTPRVLVGIRSALHDEPPAPGEPPFKGLDFFDERDAALFFGRETLTEKLATKLQEVSFLAVVIGASGSGKSSVVRAGLVPALRVADRHWRVFVFTPTAYPLEALATALTRDESLTVTAQLMDDLAREPRSLHLFLRRQMQLPAIATDDRQQTVTHPSALNAHPLLVVDQFEELFTLCHDELEREQFVDNLVYALGQSTVNRQPSPISNLDSRLTLVLTLRADFYAHLAQYPELRDLTAQYQEYIGPMTGDELRRAIQEPARRGAADGAAWEFEPGLVDLILRDVGDEPGALPLLSHALLETWKRRSGHFMTLKGYHDAGGVRGAIAQTAESTYQQLSPEQQNVARNIFLRLTELGEGTEDTRRRAMIKELEVGSATRAEVRRVLTLLADARLITTHEYTAEVAHEALIREWSRLREWLNENRDGLILHRHLTEAAHEWALMERDASMLYRGARLATALEFANANPNVLNEQERAFLQASEENEKREAGEREAQRERELLAAQQLVESTQRLVEEQQARAEIETKRAQEETRANQRLRQRALFLAIAFVLAILLAGVALFFGNRANENAEAAQQNASVAEQNASAANSARLNAEQQQRIATARELAASAIANLDVDAERSVLLAAQSVETTRKLDGTVLPEAEDALHRAVLASRVRMTLRGADATIWNTMYSPDGSWIATNSENKVTRIWDATTGQLLRALDGFLLRDSWRDPKRIATANWDDKNVTVRFWDTTTGEALSTTSFEKLPKEIVGVVIRPDLTQLAVSYGDGTIQARDAANGKELFEYKGLEHWILPARYSPDGKLFAAAQDQPNGKVIVWDAQTGQQIVTIPVSFGVLMLAFNADGTRLVSGNGDGVARVWEIPSAQELFSMFGHTNWVVDVKYSPDGKRLATASWDRTAKVWDAETGRLLYTLSGHNDFVWGVAFSPDGQQLVTGSQDKTAKIWNAAPSGEVVAIDAGHRLARGDLNVDGTRLVTAGREVNVWDTTHAFDNQSPNITLHATLHTEPPHPDAVFSPDGKYVTYSTFADAGIVWEIETGKQVMTLLYKQQGFVVAYSPDGTRVAMSTNNDAASVVHVWNAQTGKLELTLETQSSGVAFTPDGKQLVTGNDDGTISIWDTTTGQRIKNFKAHDNLIWDVRFSPDGKRMVSSSRDSTAKVWDVITWQEIFTLRGHTSTIEGSEYSRDGKWIVTAGNDGVAKIWDATTGKELLTLSGATSGVSGAVFSPDATRVITTSYDGGIRVYLTRLEDLLALAKTRVTRSLTQEECEKYLHVETCPQE